MTKRMVAPHSDVAGLASSSGAGPRRVLQEAVFDDRQLMGEASLRALASKSKEQNQLLAQGYSLLHLQATGWLPEREEIAAMLRGQDV